MAIINTIKQKILQLDAGTFQNLCDQILSKNGYPNIVSLGSQSGTQKNTPGTPDTYFILDNEMYIFVEYTTQQANLPAKIKEDILKCLDTENTGIECGKISEIIYCHTSSNVAPKTYNEINKICKEKGVIFTIWGIDKIAENLYSQNRVLAKDYLDIMIDTNQIFKLNEFIDRNDSSSFAAPLKNEFMYRAEELKNIDDNLEKFDVVILYGHAGTGKTRLAIEYAKKRSDEKCETLYCIRDNALPIYEDLKLYLDRPGNYLLLLDDANQISGLSHILYYLSQKANGINVKIIITVRDYALNQVRKKVLNFSKYGIVNIESFDKEKIEEIIKTNLEIKNKKYLDRISAISNGNARIAMIAGITAVRENSLASLIDVSKLYESYYGKVIDEFGLYQNRSLLITLGIISFIDTFHIDRLDFIEPVLSISQLSKDDFKENIYQLYSYELIDIYNNKAVKISEQCLSNYILKYVFYDKKLVSLSEMIKAYFPNNKEKTIASVNILTKNFYSKEMISFIEKEIDKIWKEFSTKDSTLFFEYVKVFYPINETATLLLLKKKIDKLDDGIFDESKNKKDIDTKITDDIINILGGFYRCKSYAEAIQLFLMYYQKRPDLYQQFYSAIQQFFVINKYSEETNYRIEFELLKQIKAFSNGWTNHSITCLFLDVAKYILKFQFDWSEFINQKTYTFNYITLHSGEKIINCRKTVWNYILELPIESLYNKYIHDIINKYGKDSDKDSTPIIKEDSRYIFKIIEKYFNKDRLKDCILVNKFVTFLKKVNLKSYINNRTANVFLDSNELHIYQTLTWRPKHIYEHYNDKIIERKNKINELIKDSDFTQIKQIIDVCNNPYVEKQYKIKEGLEILFDLLFENHRYFIETVKYYIESNTPANINPSIIISYLYQLLKPKDLLTLINTGTYSQQNEWIYYFYYHFPEKNITKETLEDFYEFLLDDSDKLITSSAYRQVYFIKKFCSVDSNAFINCCKIIYNKRAYNSFIVDIYFNFIFHDKLFPVSEMMDSFAPNMELLENIYLLELTYEKYFDYHGEYFKILYLNNQNFLEKFLTTILNQKSHCILDDYSEQLLRLYETDDYIKTYEHIASFIIKSINYYSYELQDFFDILVKYKSKEMVDKLLCVLIEKHYNDTNYIGCLFEAIANLSNEERIRYIKVFLKNCPNFEAFKKLPILASSFSWSGSEVPIIEERKEFLKILLQELNGIKHLEHKQYIEETIKNLDEKIENVQTNEILRGYY
jgi:hypothetical protein